MKKVAVVDSDPEFLEQAESWLGKAGHAPLPCPTAGKFLDMLSGPPPDLAVLCLELPGVSGWELLRILRGLAATRRMPLIAVSKEFREPEHVVRALGLGADEFLAKPVQGDVFLAQVAALLRRGALPGPAGPGPYDSPSGEVLGVGAIAVDLPGHQASVDGKAVHLTPLEFDLLVHFIRNTNRVLTRGIILQHVWKSEPSQSTRTVDKRVESLRRKLGRSGELIQTVSGVGYCLRA